MACSASCFHSAGSVGIAAASSIALIVAVGEISLRRRTQAAKTSKHTRSVGDSNARALTSGSSTWPLRSSDPRRATPPTIAPTTVLPTRSAELCRSGIGFVALTTSTRAATSSSGIVPLQSVTSPKSTWYSVGCASRSRAHAATMRRASRGVKSLLLRNSRGTSGRRITLVFASSARWEIANAAAASARSTASATVIVVRRCATACAMASVHLPIPVHGSASATAPTASVKDGVDSWSMSARRASATGLTTAARRYPTRVSARSNRAAPSSDWVVPFWPSCHSSSAACATSSTSAFGARPGPASGISASWSSGDFTATLARCLTVFAGFAAFVAFAADGWRALTAVVTPARAAL
mmetsp:Transcript_1998/g.6243  ORF Transcript_1998/g.6243 Transcript_1998/m.6243 type:complete len:354 (+) Transcript_1998:966-2027(+)